MERKVVLVTGGSSGLGRAICSRLGAQAGYTVYGTSRKEGSGEGFSLLRMDVTDEASVQAAVQQVLAAEGRIDVLINNAGQGIQGAIEDVTPDMAARIFDTNLFGILRTCRAVLPGMRERGSGLILNVSSLAANFGLPFRGLYSATKAGVDRVSEALRIETEPLGLKVVVVQPGEFNTSTDANRMRPPAVGEAYRKRYDRAMELLGSSLHYSRDPDEFARLVQRIIESPRPRPLYRAAKGLQALSVHVRHLLPLRWFERMLARHYE